MFSTLLQYLCKRNVMSVIKLKENSKYNDIKVTDQYQVNNMSIWSRVIKGQNISYLYFMKMIQYLPKEGIRRQNKYKAMLTTEVHAKSSREFPWSVH